MRTILALLAGVSLLMGQGMMRVQRRSTGGGGGGGVSLAVTPTATDSGGFGNNPTSSPAQNRPAGSKIAVAVTNGNNCASMSSSVSNTAGDTFANLGCADDGGGRSVTWFAATTTGNASDVVTANVTNPVFVTIFVYTVSGLASNALDATAQGSGTTSSVTSGAFTSTVADEIILAAVRTGSGGVTFTAGTGYTLTAGALGGSAAEYKIVSSTQTGVTASMTFDSFVNTSISVITLK